MSDEISNDNEDIAGGPGRSLFGTGADEHGLAAILLVESLIHGLVSRSVISIADAVEIVEIAADAETAIADGSGSEVNGRSTAPALISAIGTSLRLDLPRVSDSIGPHSEPGPERGR